MNELPEPDTLTEEEDDDGRGDSGVDDTAETGQELDPEQVETSAVKETIVHGVVLQVVLLAEQAGGHHAPQPRYTVHGARPHRIVNSEPDMEFYIVTGVVLLGNVLMVLLINIRFHQSIINN